MGAKRLRSEPQVYYFPDRELYAMSYVNDILTVGLQDSADWFFSDISQLLLIKHIGELLPGGKEIAFLGRLQRRDDTGIHLQAPRSYMSEMIQLLGPTGGKSVNATGTSPSTRREDCTSIASAANYRTYRRVVGELLWLVPIRRDLSYVAKELSRSLSSPTDDDFAKLKHTIRYLKGTEDYRMSIAPKDIADTDVAFDATTFFDSDGVGCATTYEGSQCITTRGRTPRSPYLLAKQSSTG